MNVNSNKITAGWLIPSKESIEITKQQFVKSNREIAQRIETIGCRIGLGGATVSFITPLLAHLSFGASMMCLTALPVASLAACLFASSLIAKWVIDGRDAYFTYKIKHDPTLNNPKVRDQAAKNLAPVKFDALFEGQPNDNELFGWDLLAPAYSNYLRTLYAENDLDRPKMNSSFTVHYLLPEQCRNKNLQAIKDEFYVQLHQLFERYRLVSASILPESVRTREEIVEEYETLKEDIAIKVVQWIGEHESPVKHTKTQRFHEKTDIVPPSPRVFILEDSHDSPKRID